MNVSGDTVVSGSAGNPNQGVAIYDAYSNLPANTYPALQHILSNDLLQL